MIEAILRVICAVFLTGLTGLAAAQYTVTTPAPRDDLVAVSKVGAFSKVPTENFGQANSNEWALWSEGTIWTWINIPNDVPLTRLTSNARLYQLKIWARGDLAGTEPPKIEVRIDGVSVGTVDVNTDTYTQPFSLLANIRSGLRKVELRFINDFYDGSAPTPRDRNVYIKELLVYDNQSPDNSLGTPARTFPMQSVSLLTGFFTTNAAAFGTLSPCDTTTKPGCRNIDFISSIGATDLTLTTICEMQPGANWCKSNIANSVDPGAPAEMAALRVAIRYARSKGLTVTLKVHVLKDGGVLQLSSWRPSNAGGFFESLRGMLETHSQVAREEGVSRLIIGAEMGGDYTAANAFTQDSNGTACGRWNTLIQAVRNKAAATSPLPATLNPPVSLALSYAATLAGYVNTPTANEAPYVCFWDKLDYIGLNAYSTGNFSDVCASVVNSYGYASENAWRAACANSSSIPAAKYGSGWQAYLRMFYSPAGTSDYFNLGIYATYDKTMSSTLEYTVDKNFGMPLLGFSEFDIANSTSKPYETRFGTKYYSTRWYADFVVDAINDRIRAVNPNALRKQAILTEVGVQSSYNVHGHWGSVAYTPPPWTASWATYVDEQARAWDGFLRAFRRNPRVYGISVWGIRPDYDRTVPYSQRSINWLVDFDFNGKRNGAGQLVTEEMICKWFKAGYTSGTCNSSP